MILHPATFHCQIIDLNDRAISMEILKIPVMNHIERLNIYIYRHTPNELRLYKQISSKICVTYGHGYFAISINHGIC